MKRAKIQVYNDEPELTTEMTDSELAQSWYALAARSDDNPEQARLCELYSKKDGVDWYFNAAFQGDAYAMYALGKMYGKGAGVDQNDTKAASWYSKASSAGISYAHYELAKACRDGIGLDEDPEYADALFKKALRALEGQEKKHPDPHAEYILATMYELGLGIDRNFDEAERWRSAADGIPFNRPQQTESSAPERSEAVPIPKPGMSDILSADAELPALAEPPMTPSPDPIPEKATPTKPPVQRRKPHLRKNILPSVKPKSPKAGGLDCADFLSMISPSVLDFKHPDYFVCGNTYRCVWAIREYPAETEQLAILRELGEKSGVTLHIYLRPVSPAEENKIIKAAENRNHHKLLNARDQKDKVTANWNMKDVETLITKGLRDKETLMHCAVFFELIASSYDGLQRLQNDAISICTRSKLVCDKLWLRQLDGFLTVMPSGSNRFGGEFERVIPTGSVGNLYPISYSGKTDSHGMYIGEDVNGTNIIIDFDARSESKTNGHILILGNSGEGKSFLVKLIITNKRQLGKKIYIIDVENEYKDLVTNLGGSYVDMMGGRFFINVLEPRLWTDNPVTDSTDKDYKDEDIPIAFRQTTRLSQHIAYLRDFFRSYKDFSTEQLDTLEILLEKLYIQFHITDNTDFGSLKPEDYPILSDLFKLAENELETYDDSKNQLYTKDVLRSLTLGLRSICVGSESKFFNGYTNVINSDFIDFSVSGMMDTNENLKNAMFLNIFSWMSHKFLTEGDTDLVIDELHMFVTNKIAVNYMRSFMKRGRKRNSDVITASQNVEDMLLPKIIEYTKPLFSIPTHSFLFNPGQNVDVKAFQQALNVPDSEWDLIKAPHQGYCLLRSGNERYHIHVIAPEYKAALFGKAGGA
jgi:hypothetical protein